jgi:hypothetical protein
MYSRSRRETAARNASFPRIDLIGRLQPTLCRTNTGRVHGRREALTLILEEDRSKRFGDGVPAWLRVLSDDPTELGLMPGRAAFNSFEKQGKLRIIKLCATQLYSTRTHKAVDALCRIVTKRMTKSGSLERLLRT